MITRPDFYAAIWIVIMFYCGLKADEMDGFIMGAFLGGIAAALVFGLSLGLAHIPGLAP